MPILALFKCDNTRFWVSFTVLYPSIIFDGLNIEVPSIVQLGLCKDANCHCWKVMFGKRLLRNTKIGGPLQIFYDYPFAKIECCYDEQYEEKKLNKFEN